MLIDKVKNWIQSHRSEAFFLAIILLIGALLRLYRIDEYLTFLGDEGRDAIVVRRLLVNFDPILVGPGTSIGNMYLGPLYYYLIAPFLFIANFSPAGPAVFIALLSVLTIYFVWHVAREWFGKIAAVMAAFLYAVSPVVVIYSRSSWNPNIMPFFSLLSIYSIWRLYKFNEFKWLIILGFSLAMCLNSHYLGLLLMPIAFLYWLVKIFESKKTNIAQGKKDGSSLIKNSVLGSLVFIFLMSPLVIFDARHEWRNFSAMKVFFTERQTTVSARPWNSVPYLYPNFEEINTRLLTGTNIKYGKFLSISIILASLLLVIKPFRELITKKNINVLFVSPYTLLLIWYGLALVGLGLYKQEVYDHYYGFFFPAPFLLMGGLAQALVDRTSNNFFLNKFVIPLVLFTIFVISLIINIANSPIKHAPNRQMQRSMEVSDKMIEESGGQKFNLAVIAERNYEGAYQYFLEKENAAIVMIDPQKADETITDQLFVVCEFPREKCDPTHDPKAGIANFGWSKIDKEWEVAGVMLYKLIHY